MLFKGAPKVLDPLGDFGTSERIPGVIRDPQAYILKGLTVALGDIGFKERRCVYSLLCPSVRPSLTHSNLESYLIMKLFTENFINTKCF